MNTTYRLVFRGEILPGHDVQRARERLSHTLKISSEQAAALFSGKQVILRKHLPESEVSRYVRHFAVLGVQVYAEVQQNSGAVPSGAPVRGSASVAEPQPSDLSLVVMAEEVTCPNCGERQPKRTLCRACAVDMNRVAQSQENALREKREAHTAQREKTDRAREAGNSETYLFGVSFSGRIGRLDYFLCFLFLSSLYAFITVAMMRDVLTFLQIYFDGGVPLADSSSPFRPMVWIVGGLGLIFGLFFSIRSAVLRCHDNGWSGWLALFLFVPCFNFLFCLALLFFPGEQRANSYGFPKESLPVFGIVLIVLLAVGGLAKLVQFQDLFIEQAEKTFAMAVNNESRSSSSALSADVEIFTTPTCGICLQAKNYMNRSGISYFERDVESNLENRKEFYERGGRGVPYIFVSNESMHGFDEHALRAMLARKKR